MRDIRQEAVFACALLAVCAGTALASNPATSDELPAGAQRLRADYPGVRIDRVGDRISAFYGKPMNAAAQPAQAVDAWWATYGDAFGIDGLELSLTWQSQSAPGKFSFYAYNQLMDGLPVELGIARVLVLNGNPNRVVYAGGVLAQRPEGGFAPDSVTAEDAVARVSDMLLYRRLTVWSNAQLVVFAGDPASPQVPFGGAPAIRAWKFTGTYPVLEDFERYSFFVDASNGHLVYVRNEKYNIDVSGTVQARATSGVLPNIPSNPPVLRDMPEIRVTIAGGGNAFSDRNGDYTVLHGGTAPVTVTTNVSSGRWVDVNDQSGNGDQALSQSVTPPGPGDFVFNNTPTEFETAEVNAFIGTNEIHNFITDRTSWTGMDFVCPANVNLNSSCNAFFDGSSINFYRIAGGCNNTAYSSVIAHEYGHFIVANLGLSQGAFGEGFGDVCGNLLYDDPVVGRFFFQNGGSVRDYSPGQPEDQFPCSGEVHLCGEVLGGSWWDIREQFGLAHGSGPGLTLVQQLFVDWSQITIGPVSGNGAHPGTVIEVLTVDDNDGDIDNGTPNRAAICAAFGPHNLPCPPISPIIFEFPDGIPTTLTPNQATTFAVNVLPNSATPTPGSGTISIRVNGGAFSTVPMTQGAPNQYTAMIPAQACGTRVDFYVSSGSSAGTFSSPFDAPSVFRSASAVFGTEVLVEYDMETAAGWTTGPGDTSSTGRWNRMDPQPTSAQPGDDVTPGAGVNCWVTDGNAGATVGSFDVDNGRTHLVSPTLDLSGTTLATIEYWRWYSNDQGSNANDDIFTVQVSNNNGSTWVNAEVVGPSGPDTAGGWNLGSFLVSDFVTPNATVRVRFIAADEGVGGSIVEAAVDDFRVIVGDCAPPTLCPGDLDGDNDVDLGDLATLLANFGSSPADPADGDIDNDDDVDLADLASLLAAFGSPCP